MMKSYRAVKDTCVAGKTIFVSYKLSTGMHSDKRAKKHKPTEEKVKKYNDRIAVKNLSMLLNTNFGENDLHCILTYRDEPNQERAKKDRETFIRRLRRKVPNLKYIAVTEWYNKRIHHHLVLSGASLEQITKAWSKNGIVKAVLLDVTGDYTKLAEYLVKETTKTFRHDDSAFKRRFSCSTNLVRPVVKREVISIGELLLAEPKPIKGYYIPKDCIHRYINPVTGMEHLEYTMVALYEPRKYKVWPKGKPVKHERYLNIEFDEQLAFNLI